MPVDTRDRQKHECYGAEWAVNWEQFGANDNLGELEDVWQYCYKLMRRQSFAKRYPATYRLHGKYKMKPERMNHTLNKCMWLVLFNPIKRGTHTVIWKAV